MYEHKRCQENKAGINNKYRTTMEKKKMTSDVIYVELLFLSKVAPFILLRIL